MRRRRGEARKYQINIRLTAKEMKKLEAIGIREDREPSYLVGWFTRWGLELYKRAGSLLELRKSTKK